MTNNTYEWCKEGIVPQIDVLQDVDMDIIGWWYDTFDRDENVIIRNVEDIKEQYPMTYQTLAPQKIECVAVSALRYHGQISGFFGVDNPRDTDMEELSLFLDMIGTFLVSLLKLRNSFDKSNQEASLDSYSALAQIYLRQCGIAVQARFLIGLIKGIAQLEKRHQKRSDHVQKKGQFFHIGISRIVHAEKSADLTMITKCTHCNTFYLLRCQRLISHRILFLYILHITNDHILIPVKGIIPPSDDIHIDILKNINLGNNPLLAPLIGIIGHMSVQIILKNIDPVRTNMITKESDKLLNLLVRICLLYTSPSPRA